MCTKPIITLANSNPSTSTQQKMREIKDSHQVFQPLRNPIQHWNVSLACLRLIPRVKKPTKIHHTDKWASTQQKIRKMGATGDSCPGFSTEFQNPNLKLASLGLIRFVENLRKIHYTTHSLKPIRLGSTVNERNKTLPVFPTTSTPNWHA